MTDATASTRGVTRRTLIRAGLAGGGAALLGAGAVTALDARRHPLGRSTVVAV